MIVSDRDRIATLEAQVRDLTAEVEAWRAYERDQSPRLERITRAHLIIRQRLGDRGRHRRIGPAVVRLLICLMDRPGRIVSRDVVYDAVVLDTAADVLTKIVDVRICDARAVLEALGLPRGGIETIWGQGYTMRPAFAAQLKELLEPAATAMSEAA